MGGNSKEKRSRSPIASKADSEEFEIAHDSASERSFLLKLGCLTEQGDRLPFQGHRCSFAVSEEHTITGFLTGGTMDGNPDEDELGSMIEVNHTHTLSLEPEAVGRVLGIEYAGLPVPMRLPIDRHIEHKRIRAMVIPGRYSVPGRGRYSIATFKRHFRDYVKQRNEELFLPGARRGVISSAHVYCLTQEVAEAVKWNWAKVLVSRACVAFRGAPSPHSLLSGTVSWFLATYISEALQLLATDREQSDGPSPAAVRPKPRGLEETAMGGNKNRGCSASEEELPGGLKRSRGSSRASFGPRSRPAASTRQAAAVEKSDDEQENGGGAANLQQHSSPRSADCKVPGAASKSAADAQQEEEFESVALSLRQTIEKTTDTAVKSVHGLTGALEQLRELNERHRLLLSDVESQKRENRGFRTEIATLSETYKKPSRVRKK